MEEPAGGKKWIDSNESSPSLSFRPNQSPSLSPPRDAGAVDTEFPLRETSLQHRGNKAGAPRQRTC
ncbi:hypothetical protein EYF80_056985 [Liparis tanakae]|uniref:Uncharacterized protein n=1 Tax=Liparis tanakae TaxID=230148 RepID=A0A4Z2EX72_9TELE|nr:hypothetical protein EYF80_056985 [Liparis tanakae]